MKTPEENKKGLECCVRSFESSIACRKCPYQISCFADTPRKVLLKDALALVRQLEAQVPKWVDVMDDIPTSEDDVLVLIGGKDADVGWFNGYDGNWRTYGCIAGEVTHWMPLPEPPKEG